MKKKIVGSILGLTISAATQSFGAGYIYFSNYFGYGYAYPVMFASTGVPEGTAGQLVDHTFSAALYAGIGTLSDPDQLTFVEGSITPFNGWVDVLGPAWNGWLAPPQLVSIPDYTSGPITFRMVVWETSGPYGETFYNPDPGAPVIQGASALWTEPEIPTVEVITSDPNLQYEYSFRVGAPATTVAIVPEPSALSLLAIGAVPALVFVARQKRINRKK
jgi:hypothetical protein